MRWREGEGWARVQLAIGPEDELGEGWWAERAAGAASREAGVAQGGGCINADEEEERPAEQEVKGRIRVDIRQDPVLVPAFGDEVQERVYVGKGEASSAFLVGYRGEKRASLIGTTLG